MRKRWLVLIAIIASCVSIITPIMVIEFGVSSSPIIFNLQSENKTNITEQIFIHSIDVGANTMSLSFGQLTIDGDRNFSAYVISQQMGCQFFENGKKESGSTNWYQLFAELNAQYPNFQINPQINPSIMPSDVYSADYYIVLEGKPQIRYTPGQSLHPLFDGTLARQNIWNVVETVKMESPESLQNGCNPYQGKPMTILHHEITLSESGISIIKDLLYEFSIGIPLFLFWAHYRYVYKNNNLATQATLFLGIIVLFFTSLFGLQQVLQPQVTIPEIILIPSMTAYSIMFVLILRRIKKMKKEPEI